MIYLKFIHFFKKFEDFYYNIYETEECRVCKNRVKCKNDQFIKKEENKVKCNECKRILEVVKRNSK